MSIQWNLLISKVDTIRTSETVLGRVKSRADSCHTHGEFLYWVLRRWSSLNKLCATLVNHKLLEKQKMERLDLQHNYDLCNHNIEAVS